MTESANIPSIFVSHDLTVCYGTDENAPPIGYHLDGREATLTEILWELSASQAADRHMRQAAWDRNFDPDAPPAMA